MQTSKHERGKTALVLGGGAARGFAHVGVLEVLESAGLRFDMIVGTSMGAMVGGLYAAGVPLAEIERVVVDMPWKKLLAYFRPTLRRGGLVGGKAIERALRALLSGADISDFPTPFAAVAVDIVTGERIVFRSGSAVTAIRASISLPGTFAPVMREGRALVDGGIAEPVPAPTARELGAAHVVACNVLHHPAKQVLAGKWRDKAASPHAPSRLKAAENGGWYEQVTAFAQRVSRRRKEKRRARGHSPWFGSVLYNSLRIQQYSLSEYQVREADVVIEPDLGDVLPSEFYRGRECVEAGRRAAQSALAEIRALFERATGA